MGCDSDMVHLFQGWQEPQSAFALLMPSVYCTVVTKKCWMPTNKAAIMSLQLEKEKCHVSHSVNHARK